MMKKTMLLLIALAFLNVSPESIAGYGFGDGLSHTIDDGTYAHDTLLLYSYADDIPGTHLDLIDGGIVYKLVLRTHSTASISGGRVEHRLDVVDNSTVDIFSGWVGELWVYHEATVNMTSGGAMVITARDNAIVTMSGGDVVEGIFASRNGTIYLDGTNFQVNGTPLVNGDKLSDFVSLIENRRVGSIYDYYTGTITGTLADGTPLHDKFEIHNVGMYEGTADIIIIPEPCSLLLLGIGVVIFNRRW